MKKIDTMSAATNIKLESNTNHTNNIASNSANNPHNLTSNEKIAHYNNLIYSIDNSNDLFIKDKDSNTILIALSNYKCYIKTLQANSDAKNPVKPYTLKTTLKPNQIYSCFGIKLWQNIKTHKLQQTQSNKSKEIISIRFNGKTLQILEKGKTTQEFTFKAQSGDNVNKETMIEEGNYYIKANEVIEANIINNVNIDINQFNLGNKYIKLHKNTSDKNIADKNTSNNNTANKNTSNNKTSNKETSNNKTLKDDSFTSKIFNLVKIQSTAYTIHGGKSYGDNKGIDLATQDLAFFEALQNLTNKYKVELEKVGNVIRVEVGYVSIEIARLKAFMYALRYGEGTLYDKGYKTLVGGGTFDDFSKHPNIYNKKLNSTAAGAYQILKKTWDNIKKYRDKYGIDDFSPKNQDKSCIILLHKIRDSLDLIMANKIDEAVRTRTDKPKKRLHYEWASLPESPYNQRTETMENFMKYYDKHLKEELQGISNLAISNGEIAEFLQLLRSDK